MAEMKHELSTCILIPTFFLHLCYGMSSALLKSARYGFHASRYGACFTSESSIFP